MPGIFGGSSKKALELFQEATTRAPNSDANWLYFGRYYLADKDYNNALYACKKALMSPHLDGKFEEARHRKEAKYCVTSAQEKLSD